MRRKREFLVPLGGAVLLALLAGLYLGQRYAPQLSSAKSEAKQFVRDMVQSPKIVDWRYTGDFGLQVSDPESAKGHLLISAYFMDNRQTEVRLIDVASGTVSKTWKPDPDAIRARSSSPYYKANRFSPLHPMPMPDGGLVFIDDGGPLVRIDACSRIVWISEGHYHHSLGLDLGGNFIVPAEGARMDKPFDRLKVDSVARVDADGRRVDVVPIPEMLLENGLEPVLTISGKVFGDNAGRPNDVTHLNDVEVATIDGPFWKRGDWLLSFRKLNLVAIYRPQTRKIVWSRIGPWQRQHDPDFHEDGTISVLGNDVYDLPEGQTIIRGHSEVYVVSSDGSITTPFSKALAAEHVGTETQGVHRLLPKGEVFIGETDHGRVVFLGPGGIKWRFNNADRKQAGVLHWSRYFPEGQLPEGSLKQCEF